MAGASFSACQLDKGERVTLKDCEWNNPVTCLLFLELIHQ